MGSPYLISNFKLSRDMGMHWSQDGTLCDVLYTSTGKMVLREQCSQNSHLQDELNTQWDAPAKQVTEQSCKWVVTTACIPGTLLFVLHFTLGCYNDPATDTPRQCMSCPQLSRYVINIARLS